MGQPRKGHVDLGSAAALVPLFQVAIAAFICWHFGFRSHEWRVGLAQGAPTANGRRSQGGLAPQYKQ